MRFFKRLRLALSYGPELEGILREERRRREEAEREARREYLSLCARHQQRTPGARHAEHNCDHCQALQTLRVLTGSTHPKLPRYGDDTQ